MKINLSQEGRADAIASIQRYFDENFSEPVGELPASLLLNFFIQEIGPVVYNQAIADAQTRVQSRVSDLNGEMFADEFQYWPRLDANRRRK
jgi:uncharacterized protein (DUF2164 family)